MTEKNSNTVECPFCHKYNEAGLYACKHCLKPLRPKTFYDGPGQSTFKEVTGKKVVVTDIDMPFLSMVQFMIKWAIATIPAMFILFIAGMFVMFVIAEMIKGF